MIVFKGNHNYTTDKYACHEHHRSAPFYVVYLLCPKYILNFYVCLFWHDMHYALRVVFALTMCFGLRLAAQLKN